LQLIEKVVCVKVMTLVLTVLSFIWLTHQTRRESCQILDVCIQLLSLWYERFWYCHQIKFILIAY